MLQDKYSKPKSDYYASIFWRKIVNALFAYPEFVFLFKILVGLVAAFLVFTLFRRFFGLKLL